MNKGALRATAAVIGVIGALALGGIAYAHVEVEVEPAVAGAANAVITFDAEAESPSAGIAKVQVFLPAGLAPSAVTLKQGPAGWQLTPTGADNYTITGPALKQGVNAVHSVTAAQLPNSTRLVFKVLVTYSNGSIDRWIEEPTTANPNPDNPAPVATLAPAPAAATTAAVTTPPATTPAAQPATTNPTGSAAGGDDSGGNTWLWWVLGLVVVAAAAGGFVLMRRRGTAT